MSHAKKPNLSLVQVEDRVVPTTGLAWPDGRAMTMSFVPDGVSAGGASNQLFQHLDGQFNGNRAAWQRDVARAYQTWAVETNINVGLVNDSGAAMGASGLVQKDTRFGDIRIGARVLSQGEGDALAVSSGYDLTGSTWTGDALFNTQFGFSRGNAAGKYDVFSTMVHEAGHAFGLVHSTDAASVMQDGYKFRTKLGGGDVTAIRALYGTRTADASDAVAANNTSATASTVPWTGLATAVSGDITTTRDIDFYKFTTLAVGESDVRIRVKTAGLSFLTPNVRVYREGQLIAARATVDPFAGEVSVALGAEYQAGKVFTIRIAGQGGSVFNRGAYQLSLEPTLATTSSAPAQSGAVIDGGTNDTYETASAMTSSGTGSSLRATGSIEVSTDLDFYRFGDVSTLSGNKLFTATVAAADATKLMPIVELVNQNGAPIPVSVVVNENGTFTVEANNDALENVTSLYLVVTPVNPQGTKSVGDYTVSANLRNAEATQYQDIAKGTLDSSTKYMKMTVGEARLVRFALDADVVSNSPATAVGVTIFNSAGKAVFSFSDLAGGYLTTGSVWLVQGDYTIAVTAKTSTGIAASNVAFDLKKIELGNPVDPIADNSGGTTGGGTVVTTTSPTPTPPLPVNDPIADPWSTAP